MVLGSENCGKSRACTLIQSDNKYLFSACQAPDTVLSTGDNGSAQIDKGTHLHVAYILVEVLEL